MCNPLHEDILYDMNILLVLLLKSFEERLAQFVMGSFGKLF